MKDLLDFLSGLPKGVVGATFTEIQMVRIIARAVMVHAARACIIEFGNDGDAAPWDAALMLFRLHDRV